jgi:tetratricopeptide (TPR) repeat protein
MRLMALGNLEEALTLDADLPEARLLIARLNLFTGGDLKKARSMLDAVVASKTADGDTRAEAYVNRSRLRETPDERIADLDAAIDLNSESAEAFRLRAAVKLSQNKAAEAVEDFDAALEIDPDSAATHEARGLALAAQQKWDEAKKSLSRAVELFPKASGAMLQRGRIAMLAGDPKSAVADADAVLKLVPDMPEALLLRSHAKFADGDKAGALADVNDVLKQAPTSSQALRTRIAILVGDKKVAAAIDDLETLARAEPDSADVVLQLAALENSLKRNRRAVERLDGLIEKEPKNWRARRIRGDALLGMGKHADAVKDFAAALEVEPKDSGILNNLAWVLATSPDDDVRDGKRAIELAERACKETEYKQAHILSTLAAAHAETGDFATAKKWSEKAVELADDEVRDNLRKELESYRAEKPWRERFTESAEAPTPKRK